MFARQSWGLAMIFHIVGLSLCLTIYLLGIYDLVRLNITKKQKLLFGLILLIPLVGIGLYLIMRPTLLKHEYDAESNNYYANGYYELNCKKYKLLKGRKNTGKKE